MAEVFISYARQDQGFARDTHAALQKVNRDTWIDWRSIPDSAKWRAEIFAAIEAADNFLFVISPDSVKSWMCGQEVSHAVANNKRLITILYHSVDHKELLPGLKGIPIRRGPPQTATCAAHESGRCTTCIARSFVLLYHPRKAVG